MKTFKDLEFKPHRVAGDNTQAKMAFKNGYGVSVVSGSMFYTSANLPYELAVLKNDSLCYDTPITDNVKGYLSAGEVTKLMKQVQEL